jgi:hypothetical protein
MFVAGIAKVSDFICAFLLLGKFCLVFLGLKDWWLGCFVVVSVRVGNGDNGDRAYGDTYAYIKILLQFL